VPLAAQALCGWYLKMTFATVAAARVDMLTTAVRHSAVFGVGMLFGCTWFQSRWRPSWRRRSWWCLKRRSERILEDGDGVTFSAHRLVARAGEKKILSMAAKQGPNLLLCMPNRTVCAQFVSLLCCVLLLAAASAFHFSLPPGASGESFRGFLLCQFWV
jgi:hypothetical protein